MHKRFLYVCTGLLFLAVSYALGARGAVAQSSGNQAGRFQLFSGTYRYVDAVNVQVDEEKAVFLIDTATGKVTKYTAGRLKSDEMYERWDPTERRLPASGR